MRNPDQPPNANSATVLTCDEGNVEFLPLRDGRHRVTLRPKDPEAFVPLAQCETSLPLDVVQILLEQTSFFWLCDALERHDENGGISKTLQRQMFSYIDPAAFRGARLLDFGCGTGGSTMSMARVLPNTEIVGVELESRNIELANLILSRRHLPNVSFMNSPDANSLPPGIGSLDFIMLSAVYEHLLPEERVRVMPLLWSHLKPGGVLFVNQTPYRYFPFEHHSTELWLINFLPDRLSHLAARKLSRVNREINSSLSWSDHLRGGIRGGTEGQILSNLRGAGGRPEVLQPLEGDRASYWLNGTSTRFRTAKAIIAQVFRLADRLFGTVPSMNLDVVIRKRT